jgi:hypothetical protein
MAVGSDEGRASVAAAIMLSTASMTVVSRCREQ